MAVVRQRDDFEAPLDDINEETDSAYREFFDDSDSIEAVVLVGRLAKSVSVLTFVAERQYMDYRTAHCE